MAIVHIEPFRDITTLHRQMNRLFDDLGFSTVLQERGLTSFTPAAELEETENALILKLEVPGMNPDDLIVEVSAESVAITGERHAKQPTKQPNSEYTDNTDKQISRSEFRYGKFQRVISLPIRIQNNQVEAEYKNGILSLTLPKVTEEKNKVVKVAIH